ncbi:hypothetical protein CDL15_Pgr017895 [Punica granatum]|uniref:Uncharacterized protein n=1 Tax=Punica granatum TaxID=22663 RepID=A0A218WJ00_PUNGR|nr:hypothetical protein CDL15_Pgr017895 [Punica granatum]
MDFSVLNPVADEHKVLNSIMNHESNVVENRVFARGTSSWRRIEDIPCPFSGVTLKDVSAAYITALPLETYRNDKRLVSP